MWIRRAPTADASSCGAPRSPAPSSGAACGSRFGRDLAWFVLPPILADVLPRATIPPLIPVAAAESWGIRALAEQARVLDSVLPGEHYKLGDLDQPRRGADGLRVRRPHRRRVCCTGKGNGGLSVMRFPVSQIEYSAMPAARDAGPRTAQKPHDAVGRTQTAIEHVRPT